MARAKSIFANTKSLFEGTVETTNEVLGLVSDQVKLTRELNKAEDSIELMESKINVATAKADMSVDIVAKISAVKSSGLPEPIVTKLVAELESILVG